MDQSTELQPGDEIAVVDGEPGEVRPLENFDEINRGRTSTEADVVFETIVSIEYVGYEIEAE